MNDEQLYVFGTGNAAVTRCYNTCFAIKYKNEFFMTDAGGGNGILGILENMEVALNKIHHIFVTHEHNDHILGIVWMIRMIGTRILKNDYDGNLHIYCHDGLTDTIETLCRLTIQKKFCSLFGNRILLIPVSDGETKSLAGYDVTFFDIHSTKARQFGFSTVLHNGRKLTCAGDEPLSPLCETYISGSDWLLHEAFCLYSDRERFSPYEKHHSTVKDACELAERLHISSLVLWHTEDKRIKERKSLYTDEGKRYYNGRLFVPDDGEILNL